MLWVTQLVGGQSQDLEQRALRASGAQDRNLPLLSFPMETVNYPRAGQGTALHGSAKDHPPHASQGDGERKPHKTEDGVEQEPSVHGTKEGEKSDPGIRRQNGRSGRV